MRHNAEATAEQFGMFPSGSHVVVGFSGGADSVALLAFLYEKQHEWDLTLTACHINHQLRGEESERDERFCRDFCKERGIALTVFREDIAQGAQEAGQSIEEYARNVRYARFSQLASLNTDRIATAHNLNDLAETQLFHLVRGTGLRGLIGIPPVRGRIVRPLLYCTREQIECYCRENGLSYVTDSTNLDDLYTRNDIRHNLIPKMQSINPSFLQSARRLSRQAMLEEDYLEREMLFHMQKITAKDGQWERNGFLNLHPAMQHRMLTFLLRGLPCGCSAKKLEESQQIIEREGILQLCKGWYLSAQGGVIELKEQKIVQPYFEHPLKTGLTALFPGKKLKVSIEDKIKYKNFENNGTEVLKNAIDYDRIRGSLTVRQKKPGDSIELFGFSKPKPFKKILNEAKIPVEQRARMAVICDEKGPLWLEGFGTRSDVRPNQETVHFMMIQIIKE